VIDTHAHLDALEDPAAAVARAQEVGVTRIVTIGTDPLSWARMLPIVEEHEGVYGVARIHPHAAASEFDVDTLERLLGHPKIVAVGEIGLDYYRDYAPRDAQTKVFIYQLGLAKRAQLPVVIHNRSADDDLSLSCGSGSTAPSCCTASRRRRCSPRPSTAAGTCRSPETSRTRTPTTCATQRALSRPS